MWIEGKAPAIARFNESTGLYCLQDQVKAMERG
jgi:hypothetical protein